MTINFERKLASELNVGDFLLDLEPTRTFANLFSVKSIDEKYLVLEPLGNYDGAYGDKDVRFFVSSPNPFYKVSKQEAVKFIATKNPNGFTVDKRTLKPITSGFSVAVSETQNSFGDEGVKKAVSHAEEKSYIEAIGGWLNSEDKQYYFDAVMVVQEQDVAAELGYRNKQKAIFDLNIGKDVPLK